MHANTSSCRLVTINIVLVSGLLGVIMVMFTNFQASSNKTMGELKDSQLVILEKLRAISEQQHQPNDKELGNAVSSSSHTNSISSSSSHTSTIPTTSISNSAVDDCASKRHKCVVSFGLYGADPKYTFGAIRNSELVKQIFPGWTCRFYLDSTVPAAAVSALKSNGAEVVHMERSGDGIRGMFWRFLVASDPQVDRYLIRDADSRLNLREKAAVDEWIQSGAKIHIMRDHPNHNYVMSGGMWGGVKGAIPDIKSLMANWGDKSNYIADMYFLNDRVWPMIVNDQIAHDSYHCTRYPNSKPFPTRRFGLEHVGQVFDERDEPRAGDLGFFNRNAGNPRECRKQPDFLFG